MSSRRGRRRRAYRPEKRVGLITRLFRNRYRPGSTWVSVGDVVANFKEGGLTFFNRVPPGARLMWRNGRIVGYTSRWNGPR